MGLLEYDSNNSGGCWWLTDEDWKNLETAGWKVFWVKDFPETSLRRQAADRNGEQRWLGALATNACKEFANADEGVVEWASIVHQDPDAEGCNCCGEPHNFTFDGKYRTRTYSVETVGWE